MSEQADVFSVKHPSTRCHLHPKGDLLQTWRVSMSEQVGSGSLPAPIDSGVGTSEILGTDDALGDIDAIDGRDD